MTWPTYMETNHVIDKHFKHTKLTRWRWHNCRSADVRDGQELRATLLLSSFRRDQTHAAEDRSQQLTRICLWATETWQFLCHCTQKQTRTRYVHAAIISAINGSSSNIGVFNADWFTELRFYVPLNIKQVILQTFFAADLLAHYLKLYLAQ